MEGQTHIPDTKTEGQTDELVFLYHFYVKLDTFLSKAETLLSKIKPFEIRLYVFQIKMSAF